jgi:predicted DNA-binding ribbon-helix-helix protein
MKSSVIKRSIVIDGRKTSVSLEDAFWSDLKEIAYVQGLTLSKLVGGIDSTRQQTNLSSAIRLFVLEHFQNESRRTAAHSDRVAPSGDGTQSAQP